MPERKIYIFRLNPTAAQEDDHAWMVGARRSVFNWALTYDDHSSIRDA